MWKTLTGVHFDRVVIADLDGTPHADQGTVRVFALIDAGPADERYDIPKFLHIMGEPEALALWNIMRAKLGVE